MKNILFLSLFVSFSSLAASETDHVLVQGSCDLRVTPDRGMVTFTAENQSKNQKDAVNKTNQQINQLKEKIEALKLQKLELKNTQYNVFPVRDYEKERYVDKGVRATLTLEVTTSDISRLGEAMVLASQVDIKNVGSLQTFLSEEKSKEFYLKCLDIAAEDARSKAQQLARKLDFKLGPVMMVNESPSQSSPLPMFERAMMKTSMAADTAGTSIEAGEQKFSTTLQVTFKIK